jgi:enediyne biosynthesis protein E4
LITLRNGKTCKHEFFYGSTYLSQSSRSLTYSSEVAKIAIVNVNGERKEVPLH